MDKKVVGLIGAVSTLALSAAVPAAAAPAAPPPATQSLAAGSFDELLQPIPNALGVLQTLDEASLARARSGNGDLVQVQYHHHHHHHHAFFAHHHHHHHAFFGFGLPVRHCFVRRYRIHGPYGWHWVVRRICN